MRLEGRDACVPPGSFINRSYGFERDGQTSYEEGGTRYDCPVYGLDV